MSRRALNALFFLLLAAAVARAEEKPEMDYGAFKNVFLDQVGGAIDGKLAEIDGKLANPATSAGDRAVLEAERGEYVRLKGRVEDVGTVEALYSSIKDGYQAIADLSKEVETGYQKGGAVNLAALTVKNLTRLDTLKELSGPAATGVDYAIKLKNLANDLDGLDTAGLSPATTRLAKSMTTLTALMSTFGDKVPLIGAFVKGYGDVGGGLLKATLAVDEKLRAAEGGEIIEGVHGSRKEMLDKLREQGIGSASRVEGFRDVYTASDGRLLIWDAAGRRWAVASDAEPGITPAELLKRYLHYARQGVAAPTGEQLLTGYTRTLVISLEPSARVVTPGAAVTLTVGARTLKDDRPVGSGFYVEVKEVAHSGLGGGSFQGSTSVPVGGQVVWQAPNNANETYTLAADLAPESKQVASSTGPARVWLRTGSPTQLTLTATPAEVGGGESVELRAEVKDGGGAPLPADARGLIRWSVNPAGGRLGSSRAVAGGKGETQTWLAPAQPGAYTVTAVYEGTSASGLLGSHVAGCQATATITVKPAEFELAVDQAERTADEKSPAVFTVTLANKDAVARRYQLRGRYEGEVARWRRSVSGWASPLEVAAGATATISFSLAPADPQATRLGVRLTATLLGAEAGREVSFAAVKGAGAETFKIAVTTTKKDGRPTATAPATAQAGAKIPLAFQAWGPRREYCAVQVVDKNKGMKQVQLFSHGPKGCSFGLPDGSMGSDWSVVEETTTWSGPGVSGSGERAEWTVPAEPGSYTVTVTSTVRWSYVGKRAGGTVKNSETETGSGSFTITVSRQQ